VSAELHKKHVAAGERALDDCPRPRVWSDIKSRPSMSRPQGASIVLRSQRPFAIIASACLVLWLGEFGVASEQATPRARSIERVEDEAL
jgi:hypothetical protein